MYNLTNLTNTTNAFQVVKEVNVLSGGLLFNLLILVIFIMLIIVKSKDLTPDTFIGITFIVALISMFFWVLHLIAVWIFILSLIFFFGSVLYAKFSG